MSQMSTSNIHTTEAVPLNIYKPSAPLSTRLLENTRLTPNSVHDVRHLVIDLKGTEFKYIEGQSLGIVTPGLDAAGKPFRPRLYSIASKKEGDNGESNTVSLCVKRVVYQNEEGQEVRGVASNHLCDMVAGSEVKLFGPIGKHFVLPADSKTPMLMFATGTGIAPFRAFMEWRSHLPEGDRGPVYLVFGVRTQADYLYKDELAQWFGDDQAHLIVAFSDEETNAQGGPMFVGDKLPLIADKVWTHVEDKSLLVYLCGLKGMETGIGVAMDAVAQKHNASWEAIRAEMLKEKRWMAETY
jgi:ferredoxin--NADP+ reductase